MSSPAPMIDGILRADPLPADTARLLALANTSPRSPGLHLSSILKALDETLHGKKYRDNGAFDLNTCAAIGFFFERMLELAFKDTLGIRPKEIELDGIHMSPDGVGEDPYGEVPITCEEYKVRWKSSTKPVYDDWYVLKQNQCYCKALGTTVGVFRVLYVVGDYSKGAPSPEYKEWRLEYAQEEIDRTWDMVIRNRGIGTIEGGTDIDGK